MKKVGILGAGQLGCMLAESLFKFGAEILFYDTKKDSPGYHRTPHFYCGEWNDEKKLTDFFSSCDVVTYEFENVSVELLDSLVEKTQTPLYPSAKVLSITQDRIHEKNFLTDNSLPVCKYVPIYTTDDLQKSPLSANFPYILKTATGGYDGKGQWRINSKNEADEFIKRVINSSHKDAKSVFPLIQEEVISIQKEVSCVTARDKQGNMVSFPIFENEHRDHILYQTLLPAEIEDDIASKIRGLSEKACQKLGVIGLLTTEFFITNKNQLLVNEFAPRPHNSAHITQIACSLSQFDVLARILLDIPVHKPVLYNQFYCMGNILSDVYMKQGDINKISLSAWQNNPNIVDIRIYGKTQAQIKRKMGHFIASGNSRQSVIAAAEKIRKNLNEQ